MFKSGEYGGQSAEVQNSTNNCWVVLAVPKDVFSFRICPLGTAEYLLSQKL
jgi:hypothetical protein